MYKTSYLLDRDQSMNGCAAERYNNYKEEKLEMKFNKDFTGMLSQYGISADRRTASGVKAAIIARREQTVSAKWLTLCISPDST